MAATTFEEVYDRFFKRVTDYTFAELEPEDSEEILFSLLEASVSTVRELRIGSYEYDESAKAFKHELTNLELQIAVLGMIETWLDREKNSVLYTQQFIGSKQLNFFNQRTHLLGLVDAEDKVRRDRNRLLSRYKTLHNTYLENEVVLS